MSSEDVIEEVFRRYPDFAGQPIKRIEPVTHGHINQSAIVTVGEQQVFFQKINQSIFKDVPALHEQVGKVLGHLSHYYKDENLPYETLSYYQNSTGNSYTQVAESYYRVSEYKAALLTHQQAESLPVIASAGRAFAHFNRGLLDLPLNDPYIPLQEFHNLDRRYSQLTTAKNKSERTNKVVDLLAIAEELYRYLEPVVAQIAQGKLPVRWTHNDTKLNNLLFDQEGEARCVVDLDTVMPGLLLFDVGDALRTIGSTLAEDDPDTDSLILNHRFMECFVENYLAVLADKTTPEERRLLPHSGTYMAAIMGFRFLTDFLMGDVYYAISHPLHNLNRAKNQLHLAMALVDYEMKL